MNKTVNRRNFLRITGALGAAAGLSAAMSACAPAGRDSGGASNELAGPVKDDGVIQAAISYELGTNGYDPMSTTSALAIAVNWHTFEGLTEMDPATGETYAALAKQLPTGDSTTVDIQLREGAKFHNGDAVTADDVVFSFERVLDPANKSQYASFIPFVESVTKKDKTTVTITTAYATGVLADRLAVVKIVPKKVVQADAADFDAKPVGTGPYKMTENGANKVVKFERFQDYNGPRPAKAASMSWNIIPDSSTRINSLQSKSVQAIDSVPYLNIEQLRATNQVESKQGFSLLFAMFNNHASNPFAEAKNRQAFLHAIDMDRVIETGMKGQAAAATSFLQENHPNYNKAKVVYTHDADKAKKLFSETGLKKLRLLCTDHDWVRQCTPLIHESLKDIGIEVDFTERKSADVYNTIDGKPDAYDVVIAPGDPSVFGKDPDLLMRWWYSGDTWTDSRMHWKGSESYTKVQSLLDEGLQATDEADAQKIWNELFDLLSEIVPLYPLFHRKTPTAWDGTTLSDFKPIDVTGLSFLDVGSAK